MPRFPEEAPNLVPLDSIRITDARAIVRAVPGTDAPGADAAEVFAADLVQRR